MGDRSGGLDLEDMEVDGDPVRAAGRLEAIARALGSAVATDEEVFAELLPDLLRGGNRAWAFGCGLASASPDLRATWARLVEGLERMALEQRNVQVLRGFLAELWEKNRDLAQDLLDSAIDQPALAAFLPELHSAVSLDVRGVERLKRALSAGKVPALDVPELSVRADYGSLGRWRSQGLGPTYRRPTRRLRRGSGDPVHAPIFGSRGPAGARGKTP